MSGVEILGAVGASIELVNTIQSCLKFIHEARKTSKHAAEQRDMHFHLVIQAVKFQRWCAAIRLPDIIRLKEASPHSWKDSQEFLDFRMRLGADLRFGNGNIADLTLHTLAGLRTKFEHAWEILQGYRSSSKEELAEPTPPPTPTPDKAKEKKNWFRRTKISSKTDLVATGSDVSLTKKVYSATKWVGFDKNAFSAILLEISSINESLITLLEMDKQQGVHRQTIMEVLDDPSTDDIRFGDNSDDAELQTLVDMKSLQDKDANEQSTRSRTTGPSMQQVYSVSDLKGEAVRFGDARSMHLLHDEKVLIEWKYYSKEKPAPLNQFGRLYNLVGLMNHNNLSQKFLTPKCKGLVDDRVNSRIGVVFTTSSTDASRKSPTEYTELQSFIRSSRDIPPVGERFIMARKLATAMHHLHSVHWLHKSFRSDNVVFFENPEMDALTSTRHDKSPIDPSDSQHTLSAMSGLDKFTSGPSPLPQLYLLGWDLSRPDHPTEFSESLSLSSANFQSRTGNMKLYSHPDTHLSLLTTDRSRYRTEFDIYSLGLVLLELGLWRTLDSLRKKCTNDADFRRRIRGEFCDKLLSRMGVVYWRVTQRCITNDFDLDLHGGDAPKGGAVDYPLQFAFEQQVVSELTKCYA